MQSSIAKEGEQSTWPGDLLKVQSYESRGAQNLFVCSR